MNPSKLYIPYVIAILVTSLSACSDDSASGQTIRCETGYTICGNQCCDKTCVNNLCLDIDNDIKNCGAYGHTCEADEVCWQGTCVLPADACGPEQDWCDGRCVPLNSDPRHCGNCTTACKANESCQAGTCVIGCANDFTRCAPGLCADLSRDNEHCGKCNTACSANMFCQNANCQCQRGFYNCDDDPSNGCESIQRCQTVHPDVCEPPCDQDQTCIRGVCVPNGTGEEVCEPPCDQDQTCIRGVCVPAAPHPCPENETLCYGKCFDLSNDNEHCGNCLHACASWEHCVNATCELDCKTLTLCDGACFDTSSSEAHCGACGQACKFGEICSGAVCQCDDNHYDCDGIAANGCESTTECPCKPDEVQSCWRGALDNLIDPDDLSKGAKGICEPGTQTCDASGLFWGPCTGGTYPSALTCDLYGNLNGLDNDCDGEIDTICRSECDLAAGSMSYIGCEYWGAYLDNLITDQYSNHTFVLSNPNEKQANVYIYDHAHATAATVTPYQSLTLEPHDVRSIEMNHRGYNMCQASGILPNAFRIRSDIPITAYQFSPLGNPDAHSNDASLLLPTNVLGKDYIGMTWISDYGSDHRSYLAVIATEAGDTEVTITTTSNIIATETSSIKINASESINTIRTEAVSKGATKPFTLPQYHVLTLMAPAGTNVALPSAPHNQTGTRIHADKNIAVFGASRASYVPTRKDAGCCRDHIEEQLFPTQAWGKAYYAARAYSTGKAGDFWLITAKEDDTTVTLPDHLTDIQRINGTASSKKIGGTIKLNAGETFPAFETRDNFEIHADKPISVGQFLPSQDYNGIKIGDPSFILTVPYEQYRSDYDFIVPDKFDVNYITVITPQDGQVHYDEKRLTPSDYISFTQLGTTPFYVGYYKVLPGVHHMVSDKPFGLYSYGYYNMSSYGYPIGLDLKILNTQ